jgi:hypothetical protein
LSPRLRRLVRDHFDGMESDDEFNQFVMNDLMDPSSSDDENDLFFDVAHVIVDGLVNHPR